MTTPQPPEPPSNPPNRSAMASFGTSGLWALAGALVTSLGFWFVLSLGGAGFVCLVGTSLGTTTGRVVVRLTLPVAVTAFAATVFDEVVLGVVLAVLGSLQVVAGVLLLLGRLLEPLVVALGVIYLGGGAAAVTVGEWPSYGIAVIALGLALTVHGVSGRLPVLVRRLSLMLRAPA